MRGRRKEEQLFVQSRLRAYNMFKARIEALEAQLRYYEALCVEPLSTLRAADISQVKGTTPADPTGNIACGNGKYISDGARKAIEETRRELEKVTGIIKLLDMALDYLPDANRFIITQRFIQCKKWSDVRQEYAVKYGIDQSVNTLDRHARTAIGFMCDILRTCDGDIPL